MTTRFNKRLIICIIGLIIIVGLLLISEQWLEHSREPSINQPSLLSSDNAVETVPDAYMKNASISNYTDAGQLDYFLRTELLKQYVVEDKMIFKKPTIDYTVDGNYVGTADQGVLKSQRYLELKGDVKMISTEPDISLTSEIMYIDLATKVINNEHFSTLYTSAGTTTGNGVHADINAQTFKLNNGVKGRYEP